MKRFIVAAAVVAAALIVTTIPGSAGAELRFGPWVYWPPYYYPTGGDYDGLCLSAPDFAPRYENPNPPAPRFDRDCCPPLPDTRAGMRKGTPRIASQPFPRDQVNAPLTDSPRSNVRNQSAPTFAPTEPAPRTVAPARPSDEERFAPAPPAPPAGPDQSMDANPQPAPPRRAVPKFGSDQQRPQSLNTAPGYAAPPSSPPMRRSVNPSL
jgi:hypothetical protein